VVEPLGPAVDGEVVAGPEPVTVAGTDIVPPGAIVEVIVVTITVVCGWIVDTGIEEPGTVVPPMVVTGNVEPGTVDPGWIDVTVATVVDVMSDPEGELADREPEAEGNVSEAKGEVSDTDPVMVPGIEIVPLGPTVVVIVVTITDVWRSIVDTGITEAGKVVPLTTV